MQSSVRGSNELYAKQREMVYAFRYHNNSSHPFSSHAIRPELLIRNNKRKKEIEFSPTAHTHTPPFISIVNARQGIYFA